MLDDVQVQRKSIDAIIEAKASIKRKQKSGFHAVQI
jgi:hypothetical protein